MIDKTYLSLVNAYYDIFKKSNFSVEEYNMVKKLDKHIKQNMKKYRYLLKTKDIYTPEQYKEEYLKIYKELLNIIGKKNLTKIFIDKIEKIYKLKNKPMNINLKDYDSLMIEKIYNSIYNTLTDEEKEKILSKMNKKVNKIFNKEEYKKAKEEKIYNEVKDLINQTLVKSDDTVNKTNDDVKQNQKTNNIVVKGIQNARNNFTMNNPVVSDKNTIKDKEEEKQRKLNMLYNQISNYDFLNDVKNIVDLRYQVGDKSIVGGENGDLEVDPSYLNDDFKKYLEKYKDKQNMMLRIQNSNKQNYNLNEIDKQKYIDEYKKYKDIKEELLNAYEKSGMKEVRQLIKLHREIIDNVFRILEINRKDDMYSNYFDYFNDDDYLDFKKALRQCDKKELEDYRRLSEKIKWKGSKLINILDNAGYLLIPKNYLIDAINKNNDMEVEKAAESASLNPIGFEKAAESASLNPIGFEKENNVNNDNNNNNNNVVNNNNNNNNNNVVNNDNNEVKDNNNINNNNVEENENNNNDDDDDDDDDNNNNDELIDDTDFYNEETPNIIKLNNNNQNKLIIPVKGEYMNREKYNTKEKIYEFKKWIKEGIETYKMYISKKLTNENYIKINNNVQNQIDRMKKLDVLFTDLIKKYDIYKLMNAVDLNIMSKIKFYILNILYQMRIYYELEKRRTNGTWDINKKILLLMPLHDSAFGDCLNDRRFITCEDFNKFVSLYYPEDKFRLSENTQDEDDEVFQTSSYSDKVFQTSSCSEIKGKGISEFKIIDPDECSQEDNKVIKKKRGRPVGSSRKKKINNNALVGGKLLNLDDLNNIIKNIKK